MVLPSTYADRNCSLARALEVVGERWTLMIIRDAFFGVRRFSDFATQLGIPRAVLTSRLKSLVDEGVLAREDGPGSSVEYRLTDKGIALWPIVRSMMAWGDEHYSPTGAKRTVRHDFDYGIIDARGYCQECGALVPVPEIRHEPGPGYVRSQAEPDPVSMAMSGPRLLLEPITKVPATS